jgi:aminoglycoside phosphotransferase family enzyme/predicted kinase
MSDVERLIRDLSDPEAWGGAAVEVRQTHASVVFLVGDRAWKVKKPVSLGFLDFSTPELRRHWCEEEVRVNRRLAPRVYVGLAEVVVRDGRFRVGGPGEPIDTAVEMIRLPDTSTLGARLERGEVEEAEIRGIGERIAAFHAAAARSPEIAAYARFDAVAKNLRDNFAATAPSVDPGVHARARALTDAALEANHDRIEARSARGVPCDTHGDLRLDHVYVFPDRPAPDDLVVLDAIEFNPAFRYADPAADVAFLAMDLAFAGRPDLAAVLGEAWLTSSGDAEARELLPMYRSYRAAVRAKVAGLLSAEPEVGEATRSRAAQDARAHWLFALGELESPGRRPALLGVGGLPGTGKSTLSRGLAAAGFEVIRSDVVRKELAGLKPEDRAADAPDAGLYTPEWTERTYAECLRRAEERVQRGGRVIVDATFNQDTTRRALVERARRNGVPAALIVCVADPDDVHGRLDRRHGDASDADWTVYQHAAKRWQPPAPDLERLTIAVPTGGAKDDTLRSALRALRERGLAD